MATRQEVTACYRAILGRDPENDDVISMRADETLQETMQSLLDSDEYMALRGDVPLERASFQGAEVLLPKNDWMLQDILTKGEYEPYVMEPFLEDIRPDTRVLDIGANVGVFTILAARKAQHVVAIEAAAQNAKIIAANVELNGLSNVTIYPVAVSDSFGMATFQNSSSSNKIVRPLAIQPETVGDIDVALSAPIDAIIPSNQKFDVVKIDIEGREYAALAGAKNLFSMRPVFFTEYSPDFVRNGCGVSGDEYLDLFFRRGYEATILHRDMSRENVGHNSMLIQQRWREYMDNHVTHLDLKMVHHDYQPVRLSRPGLEGVMAYHQYQASRPGANILRDAVKGSDLIK